MMKNGLIHRSPEHMAQVRAAKLHKTPTELDTKVARLTLDPEEPAKERYNVSRQPERSAKALTRLLSRMPQQDAEVETLMRLLLGHKPGPRVMAAARSARAERRALGLIELFDAQAHDEDEMDVLLGR